MIVDGRPTDYQPEEKDPTLVRSWLYRADKFPTRATSNDLLTEKADQQIVVNTQLAAKFLASLLKKNWQNIKVLYLKSTWDPPCRPSRLPLGYSISSSTCDISPKHPDVSTMCYE
ncbi:unnamed protein product [Peronospora effusa]|nr:unnamed protein product [Peronospora effusa]